VPAAVGSLVDTSAPLNLLRDEQSRREMSRRGQSEVLGVVLLVGVTVVGATAAGALVLDTAVPRGDAPAAELSVNVTTTAVELLHDGGGDLAGRDLRATVTVAGATTNATWATGALPGGDDRFEPGDRWRTNWTWVDASPTPGDDVTVLLVHEPSNTVLVRETTRPRSVAARAAKIGPRAAPSRPGAPSVSVSLSTDSDNDEYVVTDGDEVDVTVGAHDPDGSIAGVTVDTARLGGSNRSFPGNATATTTVDAAAGAGEGFHRATVTATDDAGLTARGRSRAVEVDATAPTVTAFDARDAGGDLNVSFESTEPLRAGSWDGVRVDVSGPAATTLTGAEFVERAAPSGGLVYTTNRSVPDGDYTVTLARAADAAGNDGGGASDAVRIGPPAPADSTPPTVDVDAPDGGETLRGGERTTVRWTASDGGSRVASVALDYSTDGGATWNVIDADVRNDGRYSWRVPAVDATTALVRVRATDGAGNAASDRSDATFVVDSTAPSVSNFAASNPDGRTVRLAFDADERLSTIEARVDGPDGGRTTLATPEFAERGSGPYSYVASYDVARDGTYDATLTVAADAAGNDGGGATDSVTVSGAVPEISGVRVEDRAEDGSSEYRVSYDVEPTASRVAVEFDDRANDWADDTVRSADSRGTVTYSRDGTTGDTFDITVRAYGPGGSVADSRTITDVSDGSNPSGNDDLSNANSPQFAGTVVDDLSAAQADYEAMYNVTNRANFGEVRVRFENLDAGGADATYTSTDPRDGVDDYRVADYGGTYGDRYRVTLRVVDADGVVVDERVVTDDADGTDPGGNAALRRASSPTLRSSTVSDDSNPGQGARFTVDYATSGGPEFGGVEVQFRNRDSPEATTSPSSTAVSGSLSHRPGYGAGDSYVVTIRVLDADGVLVDERVVTETADDPSGGPPDRGGGPPPGRGP
jgi:flagellin-like protein